MNVPRLCRFIPLFWHGFYRKNRCARFAIAQYARYIEPRQTPRWDGGGALLIDHRTAKAEASSGGVLRLGEPNHGAAFYELLDRVLPEWQHRKQRLERIMD